MANAKSEIISYKEFLKDSETPALGAGIWKWNDIEPKLMESLHKDPTEPGRGAVSFVHKDTGKAYGICPNLNMLVQVLEPGVHAKRHRHTNFAIFIVKQGSGYSIIDGERIEWKTGDVFFAPGWSQHEHCNSSKTEQAILYTVQDVPTMARVGAWFFQGSSGEGFERRIASPKKGK